jgi:hypothetical protein
LLSHGNLGKNNAFGLFPRECLPFLPTPPHPTPHLMDGFHRDMSLLNFFLEIMCWIGDNSSQTLCNLPLIYMPFAIICNCFTFALLNLSFQLIRHANSFWMHGGLAVQGSDWLFTSLTQEYKLLLLLLLLF